MLACIVFVENGHTIPRLVATGLRSHSYVQGIETGMERLNMISCSV
jgi:hypothetical protein